MSTMRFNTEPRTETTKLERPMPLGAYLFLVIQGQRPWEAPARIALRELDEVAVGRGPGRSIVKAAGLRRVMVHLEDTKMSQHHATLSRSGSAWRVKDQNSTNGTRVNDDLVTDTELEDGDLIEIGYTFFFFREFLPSPPDADAVLDAAAWTGSLVGFSSLVPSLQGELDRLKKVARSKVSVLLLGETGTGKEVLAQDIHRVSERTGQMKTMNCGGIAPGLVEAELFGHRKGAFTGSDRDRDGYFRAANGSTLFLDEVGELPMAAQATFLRVLSEGEVIPVGDDKPVKVDVRVIAATNKPLHDMVEKQTFRLDLLHRLEDHRHSLPPLRERMEDLGLIIRGLLPKVMESVKVMENVSGAADPQAATVSFHPSALRAMFAYSWPGNVRELGKCLNDAVALASHKGGGTRIELQHLPEKLKTSGPEEGGPQSRERERLVQALVATGGNVAQASRKLKMVRQTLNLRLKKFSINPKEYRLEGKR